MSKNITWIGTKESDILHTNNFFSHSITICGSGQNGNFSFSTEKNIRINYNINNPDYTKYLLETMNQILADEPQTQFMYYNPYYAHLLEPSLASHVCCLNSKQIMDLLRSKCEMRTFATNYIPVVPFERILGQELYTSFVSGTKNSTEEYIVQEDISSGGEGTYIISSTEELPNFLDNALYLMAPYYKKNIPVNINFIIFDDNICIFPPSIQIINNLNGKLLFLGTDYYIKRYNTYIILDTILQNTLKLAFALKDIGYRGIGGFDYIFVENQLLFLECNPRFQASTYLLNLSLKTQNLPSIHELNFMAFNHKSAPDFNFYEMHVPYSCIAYSYQQYLKNSFIRKEWFTHPNIVNILDDGLNEDMICDNNAYLYRVIFSTPITEITPENDLISYDNLLLDSYEWYHKVMSGDILSLKIGLLNQGIYISADTLDYIKQNGGIKDSVFDSIDIILENGMVINCPYKINYADFSPFSIRVCKNRLRLYYYQNCLDYISLEPEHQDKERLTQKNHVPYRKLSYMGGDRLRIHHTDICIFKYSKNSCKFCNLPTNTFEYTLEDIYEIIDFYLEKGGFRHILIGGASEPISCESNTIIKIVKYIRSRTDMPIYLMCLPVQDKAKLQELYQVGVTEIGFNIEIWSDEIARKIMPGKGTISRREYLTALKHAKEIWDKPYAVRSLLIIGLEEQTNLIKAINELSVAGIMPILSIFRPLPHSQMSTLLPPTNDYLYKLYKQLEEICRKYDQRLGPDCIICQNNTLSLPW